MREYKAGILLPRSSLYPTLALDLVSGLKTGLKEGEAAHVQLLFENIGFGGDGPEIYAKAEKLLLQEDVDIVVAFMDHSEALRLEPLFRGMNRMLLVLDPGGHAVIHENNSPYVYTISLQAAFGSRLTGTLAAKEGSLKNVFASSFYEAGYLQCDAYQKGMASGGGEMSSYLIVPFQREQFNIQPLHDTFREVKPDAVLAQFSAESGALFLEEFRKTDLHKQMKLYASPFTLEETWLSTISYPFDGIKGYVTWMKTLPGEANRLFLESLKQHTGKDGNIFSMLGWEAAQFIAQSLQYIPGNNLADEEVTLKMESITFESPRGKLYVDVATHHFVAPMYLVEVVQENTVCKLELIRKEQDIEEQFRLLVAERPSDEILSKWTNTYLCI